MNKPARHIDKGYRLAHYAKQSIVRCIECDTANQTYYSDHNDPNCGCINWSTQFSCNNCQLSLVSRRFSGDWVGNCRLQGNQPCSKCGTRLIVKGEIIDSYKKSLPSAVTVNCPNCARANEVAVSHCRLYDASLAIDKDFGLPLFLQVPCRFGKIWAYNQTHLTELQAYIDATLRERTNRADNASMISRLPDWMKSAKNRTMISKKLLQLQVELDNYQSTLIVK